MYIIKEVILLKVDSITRMKYQWFVGVSLPILKIASKPVDLITCYLNI